jgi:hypothetical protein
VAGQSSSDSDSDDHKSASTQSSYSKGSSTSPQTRPQKDSKVLPNDDFRRFAKEIFTEAELGQRYTFLNRKISPGSVLFEAQPIQAFLK